MAKKSYLTCKHTNMQSYTEYCLDCGYNVYTTKEEYLKDLEEKLAKKNNDTLSLKIKELEKKLGIEE